MRSSISSCFGFRRPARLSTFLQIILIGSASAGFMTYLGAEGADVSGEKKEQLRELLPAADQIEMEPSGEPQYFSADTLYEYINGASEGFLNYNFEYLIQQVYSNPALEVTVEIYDMGSALNAFGVYSSERFPNYDFLSVGNEGYRAEYILNFWKGRYYVKLSAFAEGDIGTELENVARFIADRIPEEAVPGQLDLLPSRNRLPHTMTYIKKAPMGHEFLSPAMQARYGLDDGKEILITVSMAADASAALERLGKLEEHFVKRGESKPLEGETRGFTASSRYEGSVLVVAEGSHVVIISDPPAEWASLYRQISESLKSR